MSAFFPHDLNARNDKKCLMLRAQFGYEGYGIWNALLEMMAENDGELPHDVAAIALGIGADDQKLIDILEFLLRPGIELLHKNGSSIYNPRMVGHCQTLEKMSAAGIRGNTIRWGKKSHPPTREGVSLPDRHPNRPPNREGTSPPDRTPAGDPSPIKQNKIKEIKLKGSCLYFVIPGRPKDPIGLDAWDRIVESCNSEYDSARLFLRAREKKARDLVSWIMGGIADGYAAMACQIETDSPSVADSFCQGLLKTIDETRKFKPVNISELTAGIGRDIP